MKTTRSVNATVNCLTVLNGKNKMRHLKDIFNEDRLWYDSNYPEEYT